MRSPRRTGYTTRLRIRYGPWIILACIPDLISKGSAKKTIRGGSLIKIAVDPRSGIDVIELVEGRLIWHVEELIEGKRPYMRNVQMRSTSCQWAARKLGP
jgi:hypothetical protein